MTQANRIIEPKKTFTSSAAEMASTTTDDNNGN